MRDIAEKWRALTLADVHNEGARDRRGVDPLPREVLDLQAGMRGGLQELRGASGSDVRAREGARKTHEREEATVEVRPDALVGREVVERRILDHLGAMRRRPVRLIEATHDLAREPERLREQTDEFVAQFFHLPKIPQECLFEARELLLVWPLHPDISINTARHPV